MLDEQNTQPEPVSKVRRSIFISQELEASLARLAEERGTTVNGLISEILMRAVADLATSQEEQK